MKIVGQGFPNHADGSVFVTYFGPANPDGSIPSKTVTMIADKDTIKLFEQKSDQKVQDQLNEIIDFDRVIGSNPTLDSDGKLDPPGQPYTPDPEYDNV